MDLAGSNTLVVRPYVKQVKFINGGARFFAGSFAGSSVIIDIAFIDEASGEVMAEPGYYRKASAMGDGFGIGDNRMLSEIAEDVGRYVQANR